MSVYVDDMYKYKIGEYGRMKMSHMISDNHEELMGMAKKIGVHEKWLQYPGQNREHFDICLSKRKKAIEEGAIAISMRELALK